MTVLKCKMCGGTLEVQEGKTVCECEYCGSKQTVPGTDDEKRLKLYERANRLRFECEFDKAAGVYEAIVADYQEEAEAYWGLVLCKYGIEYVDDPGSHKKIPTCHRSSFDSVMDDANFELVMENSDTLARGLYREEAKRIEEIRKGIIQVSSTEEPYDIFICYKETAEDGQRTIDSVIAQNVYEELAERGYRVFFSRITLEDKLGQEYEPYIFAALNSAKVMLVFGTSYEYYNAVWVKNEWSRYLQLITAGQKKILIPCYKDIDAYDMPKEFKHLQAQDMGKVGAVQDLIRGVDKIMGKEKIALIYKDSVKGASNNEQLIKRGTLALEDGEWERSDAFFEEALNQDAENAEAYLGKWLSKIKQSRMNDLVDYYVKKYIQVNPEKKEACSEDSEHVETVVKQYEIRGYLSEIEIRDLYKYDRTYLSLCKNRNSQKAAALKDINSEKLYQRAKQYAKNETALKLEEAISSITRILDGYIQDAVKEDEANVARIKNEYVEFIKETDEKVCGLYDAAVEKRTLDYRRTVEALNNANDLIAFEAVKKELLDFNGYAESKELLQKCDTEIARIKKDIKQKEEADRQERERKIEQERIIERKRRKKRRISISIIALIMAAGISIAIVVINVIIPNTKLKQAVERIKSGDVERAKEILVDIDESKRYSKALSLAEEKEYEAAYYILQDLTYQDSKDRLNDIKPFYNQIQISKARVGSYVIFGNYEQDNNIENGKEELEWLVLERRDDRVLLVSRFAIDRQEYAKWGSFTWDISSLREWLNSSFINTAFSNAEQSMIPKVMVQADKNLFYDTYPGENTSDQVYLLSMAEVDQYFPSNEEKKCVLTDYAKAQGGNPSRNETVDGRNTCIWWLRTPGETNVNVSCVYYDGSFEKRGFGVDFEKICVRPVIWVEFEH